MYDMYDWNNPEISDDAADAQREQSLAGISGVIRIPAAHAVQVALDRRDNGGYASPDQ